MSHTSKSPPLKYTTADLPTDFEVGSLVLDSTTSEHKVFNGSSWDVVEGGGAAQVETKTQTIVWEDDQGNLDQLIGDIPVDWKRLSSIKRLYIGSSCTSIGSSAFGYCSSLTGSLTIPDSVTTIGSNAFYSCIGFTGSLTIGNSVTSIPSLAFGACTSITSINILATTAPTIFGGAFDNMTSVSPAVIHVPSGATGYAASYDGLTVVYDL